MAMTLTMTVKARGHLVLDFAYLAARTARETVPLRLATVDGVTLFDLTDDVEPMLLSSPNQST